MKENKDDYIRLIKEAVEYLLEADLREENGYTEDVINKLKK